MTRHKWADVITAWAEGRKIQRRYIPNGTPWKTFAGDTPSFNCPDYEFRIAADPKYRWVMRDKDTGDYWITDEHYSRDEIRPHASADPVMPIEETRRDE